MAADDGASSPSALSRALNKTKSRIAKSGSISASSSGRANEDEHHIRSSIDSAVEKLHLKTTRSSSDSIRTGDKIKLPGLLSRRKHHKDPKDPKDELEPAKRDDDQQQQQPERGRSTKEKTVESERIRIVRSEYSESSLVTIDSNPEFDSAPPLLSRPSHAGYLTTSSPLVKATTDDLALVPETKDISRSRSPAGKFKNVFKSSPSRRATSPSPSPDRDPLEPAGPGGGSGGGLGSLFGTKKAGSRRASTVVDESTRSKPVVARPSTAKTQISVKTSSPPLTPTTTITPPTPVLPSVESPLPSPTRKDSPKPDSDIVTSPSGLMISHRRSRSTPTGQTPSKLSNAISAPLTPIDEPRTNGSTQQGSPGSTGFFSTVFSAAQNVASSLGNTIALSESKKGSTNSSEALEETESKEEVITTYSQPEPAEGQPVQRPAIETLGQGELSLDHFAEASSSEGDHKMALKNDASVPVQPAETGRPSTPYKAESVADSPRDDSSKQLSPPNGARLARPTEPTPYAEDVPHAKPRSVNDSESVLDHEVEGSIKRSGSVRSKVGAVARRKRGSSAGGTIAAAIGATNAALGHHTAQSSVPRTTGFAVASKRRNRDFHQLFRSVPEDDYLIEDYSAAIQRDILMHGRLYVSEGHICFNANIFGWVTTAVISFDEVVSIEKKSTAMVFPNAIVISTLQRRNVFASFVSRDSTYDLLIGIWKISHPNLKSSANGITLDDSASKTVKESESEESTDEDDENDDEEMYDEDEEDEDIADAGQSIHKGAPGSDIGDADAKSTTRKVSENLSQPVPDQPGAASSPPAGDFPGPATHAPTSCTDQATHYEKVIKDEVIAAPLGKTYNLLFGAGSGAFMSRFLADDQKVTELQLDDDKKGLTQDSPTRNSSYIKPLNASIGPKQTKCIITETLDMLDLEKAVSVTVATQTPDVPSGNVFSVKTKYCLTWAEGNGTRLVMNCTVEWTGKSWLKTPIEKGANDGQVTYAQALFDAIRNTIVARPRGTTGGKASGKGKTRRRKGAVGSGPGGSRSQTDGGNDSSSAAKRSSNWGMLDPVRPLLEPVLDIIRPLASSNVLLGGLVVLVLVLWFSSSWTRVRQPSLFSSSSSSTRVGGGVVWEDVERARESLILQGEALNRVWRRQERELWDWLEERAGLAAAMDVGSLSSPSSSAAGGASRPKNMGGKKKEGKVEEMLTRLEKAVDDEGGKTDQEVEAAIATTEEKLKLLKEAVEKRREKGRRMREEYNRCTGEI